MHQFLLTKPTATSKSQKNDSKFRTKTMTMPIQNLFRYFSLKNNICKIRYHYFQNWHFWSLSCIFEIKMTMKSCLDVNWFQFGGLLRKLRCISCPLVKVRVRVVIFSVFLKKNTSGSLILSLGKFGLISYSKNIYVLKNTSSELIISELVFLLHYHFLQKVRVWDQAEIS